MQNMKNMKNMQSMQNMQSRQNLQTHQTKPTKPNQAKPTKPNLTNQTFQTNPIKPNLPHLTSITAGEWTIELQYSFPLCPPAQFAPPFGPKGTSVASHFQLLLHFWRRLLRRDVMFRLVVVFLHSFPLLDSKEGKMLLGRQSFVTMTHDTVQNWIKKLYIMCKCSF